MEGHPHDTAEGSLGDIGRAVIDLTLQQTAQQLAALAAQQSTEHRLGAQAGGRARHPHSLSARVEVNLLVPGSLTLEGDRERRMRREDSDALTWLPGTHRARALRRGQDQASISALNLSGRTARTSSISPGETCALSTRATAVTATEASVSPAMRPSLAT